MSSDRSNNTQSRNRRNRIRELALQLQELTEQLNDLILEDNNQGQQPDNLQQPRDEGEFREGDRVRIRNNHRGLRGAVGTVVNVTRHQVSIRLEGQNRIINRKQSNVELIQ